MSCGDIDLHCMLCRLSKGRTNVVPGTGPCEARIVFIGEAPGKDEDLKAQPFVGRAGRILDEALLKSGVDRSKVYITNLVKCRPPGNRKPRKDEIRTCSVYLESELKEIQPSVVCALGQTAAQSLLDEKRSMEDLVSRDRRISLAGFDVRLFVAYHPAACLYQRRHLASLKKQVRRSLSAAGLVKRKR